MNNFIWALNNIRDLNKFTAWKFGKKYFVFPRLLIAGWNDNIRNLPVDRVLIAAIKVWHGSAEIPK